ncbi:hypothetical protein [Luteolibacter marinus]|uniref:hypothetical protein n=1 Tax=Luteolibacter marinus TaxID=2776705 RepID=UPI00186951C6|nr:hypothetical protein [Luteolibacter marinus]
MKPLCCVAAALTLASCGQMSQIKQATTGGFTKVSEASKASFAKLMPARVPIVEVRAEDLKDLPSGQEQALAFEKTRRNRFWIFSGPVDFEEPQLPDDTGAMNGDLLPPKVE